MARRSPIQFDEIGVWSRIKLDIVREYASAYSTILSAQRKPALDHVYVDGFAGGGKHLVRGATTFVPGSPLNALHVKPPFKHYYFIDLDETKAKALSELASERADVDVYQGDCNEILLTKVFPKIRFDDYRRGLCLLDPYGLHLNWEVIHSAGQMRSIDVFLNFPVMDMNRNALWRNPDGVSSDDIARMNAFWGDESWREAAYRKVRTLFDEIDEKRSNREVVGAFQDRLSKVAGFKNVPEPLPMKNSKGAVVYYLFFASQKLVAQDIIESIFRKYSK